MRVKRSVKVWGVAAAMMTIVGAAPARADERVVARVPFDFVVGQRVMPAGKYVFTEQTDPAVVAVSSADGEHFSFVLTFADSSDDAAARPELVFDRVGTQYFLVRIVGATDNVRGIPLTDEMKARVVDRVAVALDSGRN